MNPRRFLGVDLGSTTAKAVVIDEAGAIRAAAVVQMGAVSRAGMQRAVDDALREAGIGADDLAGVVSTGYGRRLVPLAQKSFTEITCHARGAAAMVPDVRLLIDIGGQDSKAILVGEDGVVDNFAVNDRCASGTGRFYDVLARAIEVDIDDLGELALHGSEDLEVSSMCATFAETEIISLLAQGSPVADIAASVHRAIAARTLALVAQVGKHAPVVLTGGVARNPAARRFLAEALHTDVLLPPQPQITGAYGAALLACEQATGGAARPEVEQRQVDAHSAAGHSCADCSVMASNVAQLGPLIPVRGS